MTEFSIVLEAHKKDPARKKAEDEYLMTAKLRLGIRTLSLARQVFASRRTNIGEPRHLERGYFRQSEKGCLKYPR